MEDTDWPYQRPEAKDLYGIYDHIWKSMDDIYSYVNSFVHVYHSYVCRGLYSSLLWLYQCAP